MPRGAKGWPIVTYEGPTRVDVIWIVAIFGVFFPGIVPVAASLSGGQVDLGRWLLAMYPLFGGVIVFLIGLMYFAGGRVRWTPTAVLWVPPLFRPKFVRFADARRLRKGAKRVVFDVGRLVDVPAVGHLRDRRSAALRPKREQVDAWLDQHFAPRVESAKRDWRATAVQIFAFFVVTPLATLLMFPVVFRQAVAWVVRFSHGLSAWQQGVVKAAGVLVIFGMIALLPIVVFAIAKYGFGIETPKRYKWRLRRERWQGFEVEPAPPVASAPPSL